MQSASPTGSGSASPSRRTTKKRGNNNNSLLRDYYGLGAQQSAQSDDQTGNRRTGEALIPEEQIVDRTNPDGTAFDVELAFKKYLQQHSLAQLLHEESTLLTNIRELDGERQSLVYNHHHELVSASETMRKMKERANDLLPSLNSLQSSLQSISATTHELRIAGNLVEPPEQHHAVVQARSVVELPQRLRDVILLDEQGQGLAKAQSLWGSMESVLATWDEAGVKGAKEIMHTCRLTLREAQQQSVRV